MYQLRQKTNIRAVVIKIIVTITIILLASCEFSAHWQDRFVRYQLYQTTKKEIKRWMDKVFIDIPEDKTDILSLDKKNFLISLIFGINSYEFKKSTNKKNYVVARFSDILEINDIYRPEDSTDKLIVELEFSLFAGMNGNMLSSSIKESAELIYIAEINGVSVLKQTFLKLANHLNTSVKKLELHIAYDVLIHKDGMNSWIPDFEEEIDIPSVYAIKWLDKGIEYIPIDGKTSLINQIFLTLEINKAYSLRSNFEIPSSDLLSFKEYDERLLEFVSKYFEQKKVPIRILSKSPLEILIEDVRGEITKKDLWERIQLIVQIFPASKESLAISCIIDGKYTKGSKFFAPDKKAYERDMEDYYRDEMRVYAQLLVDAVKGEILNE